MKTVILAGGLGTRLAEETEVRPKPMVEIGGMPILWHILKICHSHGLNEFYIALGYKGEYIKRWFVDYANLGDDMTIQIQRGDVLRRGRSREDWTVHLVETGKETYTGGRIHRLRSHLFGETFMVTYGDGVANVDISKLIAFHRKQMKIATVTAVRPPARFGGLLFEGDLVSSFTEKPQAGEGWINGGFLIFEPAVFDYLEGDGTILEAHTLERLAEEGQLAAYRHPDFWQCMDTLRDKQLLENLWTQGKAPWKTWE
jgi:glucose-1-phosphate cytidylyltransferase